MADDDDDDDDDNNNNNNNNNNEMDWIDLAQDRNQQRPLVKTVMNLQVP
jgi:hypothetical protein